MRGSYAAALPRVDGGVITQEGGVACRVSDKEFLRRFLIIGTTGGTFYTSEFDHTKLAVAELQRILEEDPWGTMQEVDRVANSNHAVSKTPAIFMLCLAMSSDNLRVRQKAYIYYESIIRTGADQLAAAGFVLGVDGSGRSRKSSAGWRRVVGDWYRQEDRDLAYQLLKYKERDGVSHARILRMARPTPRDAVHNELLRMASHGFTSDPDKALPDGMPRIVTGYLLAHFADERIAPTRAAQIVSDYALTREMLPSHWLNWPEVWAAMLQAMPFTAMVRNLGVMSGHGLFSTGSHEETLVLNALNSVDRVRSARVHPMTLLRAQRVYKRGGGARGSKAWAVNMHIADALEQAFYMSFDVGEQAPGKHMIAVNCSGSMRGHRTPDELFTVLEVAAVMAKVAYEQYADPPTIYAFDDELIPVEISSGERLVHVVSKFDLGGGWTQTALPFQKALDNAGQFDSVTIYTDNVTASRDTNLLAERSYRESGMRSVGVAMASNNVSVLRTGTPGTLNVVGFDASAPRAIASFVERGV